MVFATARNKHTSTHLNSLLEGPQKNIYVLEADVIDPKTLQASLIEGKGILTNAATECSY